jgi:hypothetical protein
MLKYNRISRRFTGYHKPFRGFSQYIVMGTDPYVRIRISIYVYPDVFVYVNILCIHYFLITLSIYCTAF